MTITFSSPEAPTVEKEVDYGDGEVCVEPVSTLPTVNVANATAWAVMGLLGLGCDSWGGRVEGESMDGPIAKAIRIVNGACVQGQVVEASETLGSMRAWTGTGGITEIGRTATLIDMGVPEERLRRVVGNLLELFKEARRLGYSVSWG